MNIFTAASVQGDRLDFGWHGSKLPETGWRVTFTDAVISELDRLGDSQPEPESIPHCTAFMQQILHILTRSTGIVVASGLPFDQWRDDRLCAAVLTLAGALAPLMHQTYDGRTIYDVRNSGIAYRPGVRRSITNAPQPFHTDGPWLASPPQFIGLHCVSPSARGGHSRCISVETLLDDLAMQAPDLYQRLSRDLPWHRQGEHAPGDLPVAHHPLWWVHGGERRARVYTDYVHSGARLEGAALDLPAMRALNALEELAIDRTRWLEFRLKCGDVLWVNNLHVAHGRTGFGNVGNRRHLIRTWHRAGTDPRLDA